MSSQRLRRLASETGRTPAVIPLDRELPPRRSWKRWLPPAFLALSLVALCGMVIGLANITKEGISVNEGIELALMATLVAGIVTQARQVIPGTPTGRWIASHLPSSRRRAVNPASAPRIGPLDAVSAEDLAARHPAPAPRLDRRGRARQLWAFLASRGLLLLVLMLALVGFVALLAGLAWAAWAGGITDPGVLLGAPFAALGGYATWQLFAGASRSAYRGRPLYLAIRAFRDTIRIWSGGSAFARVALTGGATASVAGATIVPAVLPTPYEHSVFVHDRSSGMLFQIDLDSGRSAPFGQSSFEAIPRGLMTSPKSFRRGEDSYPAGTMLAVVNDPAGKRQAVLALRPAAQQADVLGTIEPPLPAAFFAATPGGIVAVNPQDGGYWRIDHQSGTAVRAGSLQVPAGPLAWSPSASVLAMVSNGSLHVLDPETGALRSSFPLTLPAGQSACGLAAGPKGAWVVTTGQSATLHLFDRNGTASRVFEPIGEPPAEACAVAIARRRPPAGLAVGSALSEAPAP